MIKTIKINDLSDIKKYGDFSCAHGFFDGVHLAHKELILSCVSCAKNRNLRPAVITFNNKYIYSKKNENSFLINERLTSDSRKIKILEKFGIEFVFVINLANFSHLSGLEYFDKIIKPLGIKHFIMGKDNRLGQKGSFTSCDVKEYIKDVQIDVVDIVAYNGHKLGSTEIKKILKNDNLENANELLGYYYSIEGKVIEGNKIGRTIGFPTANIMLAENYVLPRLAVYATLIEVDGVMYKSMTNIGYNPSIMTTNHVSIETNIFDFSNDIYGKFVNLFFVKTIREEIKFANIDELKARLAEDKIEALKILNNLDENKII